MSFHSSKSGAFLYRNALSTATLSAALVLAAFPSVAQNTATDPRQNWGLQPLGPNVPPLEVKPAEKKRSLQTRLKVVPASGEKLTLAQDNRPLATLVVPAASSTKDSSRLAAGVLQEAWEKISGAKLPIVTEDKLSATAAAGTLVSLGDTELAKKAGISAAGLQAEGYRLQTQGKTLFIVGNDQGKGFAVNGTRNGAYALLERHFGYRWLWPGADGEVFERQPLLTLSPLNEQDEPALPIRGMRNYYPTTRAPHAQHTNGLMRLNRETPTLISKGKDSSHWFDAMALGRSTVYSYGHAYDEMWEKYGKTHPEYFALQPNGSRDQEAARSAHRSRLDVSNDELIKTIAADIIAKFKEEPNRESASISPNDGGPAGFCMCEVCRRLDPPNAPKITLNLGDGHRGAEYVSLTDRYVTFYAKIAEIVGKEFPDRVLGSYAYSAYRTPPLYAKLPPNVLVGFVGLSYFNEEQRQENLRDWDAWTRAANRLLLRPNALIAGHGLPAFYARKLGADVKHCYETGMMATDFDSVMHNWAGQGINYYVLAKLLWDPSQDVDALIKDYTDKGFGKASPTIQRYFTALEELTNQAAAPDKASANEEDAISRSAFYSSLYKLTQHYTPEKIDNLQNLINQAKTEAAGDQTVLKRITFLEQGLRYAKAEIEPLRLFMEFRTDRPDNKNPEKRQEILRLLQARQAVFQDIYDNHFYAQNVLYPLHRETSMWRGYGWNPGNEK